VPLQLELGTRLKALGGQAFTEVSIVTLAGVLVPDVAWADDEFMRAHEFQTPYTRAPQICVEIVSPSNSRKELREKTDAYLAAAAREVWLVYPKSRRFEFYGERGLLPGSAYPVELAGVFK
jgi:Uma2 family endonuclease